MEDDSANFKKNISNLKWIDVEAKNGSHSWNKNRGGLQQIASHLDRYMMLESFFPLNLNINATIVQCAGSDHLLNILNLDIEGRTSFCPFDFEKLWLAHK